MGIGDMLSGINWGGLVVNILMGASVMLILSGLIVWWFFSMKNKKVYIYPCSLIMLKENGSHKRRDDLKGGLVKQRNGVTDFVIKIPKSFKKRKLGYVPDFSLADAKERLTFLSSGDGVIWQQCREKLITEKEMSFDVLETEEEIAEGKEPKIVQKKINVSLLIEPIPTDVKHVTINNIQAAESILEGNKLKATALIVGGFVLMVMTQVIFLFFVSK